jgi:SAM-dependent methyltransferase
MQLSSDFATDTGFPGQTVVQAPVCHSSSASLTSAWVERWLTSAIRRTHLSPESRVKTTLSPSLLDWACGSGRHSILATSLGFKVTAVDQDVAQLHSQSVRDALDIDCLTADLEVLEDARAQKLFTAQRFDVIVVSNYLFRPRLSLLFGLLAPGGLLVYETFADGNAVFGKPSRPAFLLENHELIDRTRSAGLNVLGFEQGYVDLPKPAVTQRICAQRPL